jgi:STE24 endopeptidase
VVDIGGDKLVFNLASLSIGFIVLINIMVPILVIPCFFTFSELEQGNLKSAIFDEARKTNVRVSEINVIDGSKRSSHSNAFVTGFWKWRKVVIFDTLIE